LFKYSKLAINPKIKKQAKTVLLIKKPVAASG